METVRGPIPAPPASAFEHDLPSVVAVSPWGFYLGGNIGGAWMHRNNSTGWLLGAGIEWAFVRSWSAKIEYEYLGLNSRTFVIPVGFPGLGGDTFTTSNRSIQMVKAGINYRFNWISGY